MRRTRRSAESAPAKEGKKKRARFAAKAEEVHGFTKDEKIGSELDKIFSGADSAVAVTKTKVPGTPKVLRKAPSVVEEELKWDVNEDYSSAFALDGLGDKTVKVTKDTRDLSIAELRAELKSRDLATDGGREALLARLEAALTSEQESPKGKRKAAPKATSGSPQKAAAKKETKEEAKTEPKKPKAKPAAAAAVKRDAEAKHESPAKKQRKSPAKAEGKAEADKPQRASPVKPAPKATTSASPKKAAAKASPAKAVAKKGAPAAAKRKAKRRSG